MKFLTTLQWPFRIWQIFGMTPIEVINKSTLLIKNTKLQYYSAALLIIHFILLIFAIALPSIYVVWPPKAIPDFDVFVAMITIRLVACVIVSESILKLSKQTKFIHQIMRVDLILRRNLRIQIDYKADRFHNNMLTLVWILSCFACITCVYIVFYFMDDGPRTTYWLLYSISFMVYSIHYHRIVVYVRLILRRYRILNQYIEKMCLQKWENTDSSQWLLNFDKKSKITDDLIMQPMTISQLADVRNVYQLLYETTEMVNDMFRWSLPLCIALDFHRLIVNFYFVFAVLLLKTSWNTLILAIVWGSINFGHLILLSHACHYTNKQVILPSSPLYFILIVFAQK